jgi:hypothetical protein
VKYGRFAGPGSESVVTVGSGRSSGEAELGVVVAVAVAVVVVRTNTTVVVGGQNDADPFRPERQSRHLVYDPVSPHCVYLCDCFSQTALPLMGECCNGWPQPQKY